MANLRFIALSYSASSTRQAKEFVLRCDDLVEKKNLLWVSFQANAVCDLMYHKGQFEQSFYEMKKELQHRNFHFPHLKANMRNSGPISEITVDNSRDVLGVSKLVNHLKSTVNGPIPTLLPVKKRILKTNLKDVMELALSYFAPNSCIAVGL